VPELKEIDWRGDSRKIAHAFPKGARKALGKELTRIQFGLGRDMENGWRMSD
jgi:phage-related protein